MQMAYNNLALIFPKFKFTGYLMDLQGDCIELQVSHNP